VRAAAMPATHDSVWKGTLMHPEYIEAMEGVSGLAGSPWLTSESTVLPTLDGAHEADVVIVGGGITGALVARRLSARGRHVVVLERRRMASGTTGHSTAKVTALHGTAWRGLLGAHPRDKMHAWALANLAAVDELSNTARVTGTTCGLRTLPAYLVAGDATSAQNFGEHIAALVSVGIPVSAVDSPDPFSNPAAELPRQVMIDPAAFVAGVLSSLGPIADLYEDTAVRSLEHTDDGWLAHCDGGSVRAPIAVMADHSPMHDTGGFFGRLFPYTHYVLEIAPRTALPDGMWLQVGGENLTLRPTSGQGGTWIASGQRVRVGSVDDEREIYTQLEESVTRMLGKVEVVRHWSTHDHETSDGLPFIGEAPLGRNLFLATGYAGWGMTKSVVAASIIADAVEGRSNAIAEIVSPSRLPGLNSLVPLAGENATVGREFITGHLTSTSKLAHSDSVAGQACTHLGCETKWNTAEGTVDCPCHGSRFGRDGSVIYGPASNDIEADA